MSSKMSQLHAVLEEQLAELGYETFEEAEAAGYIVDYNKGWIVSSALKDEAELLKAENQAHEDWEKERRELLVELKVMRSNLFKECLVNPIGMRLIGTIDHAISFIKRSSM